MQETQESWDQSLGQEDPLEEVMATHSSTFAWRIPWTEEPGGLQPMGSQRVGHDWSDLAWSVMGEPILWGFLLIPSRCHDYVYWLYKKVHFPWNIRVLEKQLLNTKDINRLRSISPFYVRKITQALSLILHQLPQIYSWKPTQKTHREQWTIFKFRNTYPNRQRFFLLNNITAIAEPVQQVYQNYWFSTFCFLLWNLHFF